MTVEIEGTGKLPRRIVQAGVPARKLSYILRNLADEGDPADDISVAAIRDAMGDRSFAALLVLFAALNGIPTPPGSSLILSLPLILVSAQMVMGYQAPWLPRRVLTRSVTRMRFRSAATRLVPWLERLEGLVKPRGWPFAPGGGDRLIGAVTLLLSIVLFLPIPFGNFLPSLAIAAIGLALSERDGIMLSAGIVTGVLALIVIGGVVGTAGVLAGMFFF